VGVSAASAKITVKNTGTAVLTIKGIALGGTNATSFSLGNGCGTTLGVSASCTLTVGFKPLAVGSLSAKIALTDGAADSPQTITLAGTGKAAAVKLSATSYAFSKTTLNASASSAAFTVNNPGNAALAISSIALSGANSTSFSLTNGCGFALAPSASCTLIVGFNPKAKGALSAKIALTDNAADSPQSIALSGTGK
jgi:hypothetical protein